MSQAVIADNTSIKDTNGSVATSCSTGTTTVVANTADEYLKITGIHIGTGFSGGTLYIQFSDGTSKFALFEITTPTNYIHFITGSGGSTSRLFAAIKDSDAILLPPSCAIVAEGVIGSGLIKIFCTKFMNSP